MESWIVETKNLKKYYQLGSNTVKALDGVNFRVKPQEFVATACRISQKTGGICVPEL